MYKGIFWITDKENLHHNDKYLIKIKTDRQGTIIDYDLPLNSRNRDNYAHKETWKNLPYELTRNKPFDYYPRGRIEIRKGKCIIYINLLINTDRVISYLIKEFELLTVNDISVINDNSNHYKSNIQKIDKHDSKRRKQSR